MAAVSVSPCVEIRSLVPVLALFVIFTRLIAAAAPMLAIEFLSSLGTVALPLAMTFESTSSEVLSVSNPLLLIVRPSAGVAMALAVRMAMAAAAATVSLVPPSSPLFVSGVFVAPESVPLGLEVDLVESFDALLPRPRLLSAFWFRSVPVASLDAAEPSVSFALEPVFPAAPASLAVDSVSFADAPSAVKLAAVLAARLRWS